MINGTADTGWLDRAGLTDEARVAAVRRRRAAVRRRRRVRGGGGAGTRRRSCARPAAAGPAPATPSAVRSSWVTRARPTALNVAQISPQPVPGRDRRRRRHGRRGRDRPDERVREPADASATGGTTSSRRPPRPGTWSRWTASATGSAGTRAAWSVRPRRPWWWRVRAAAGDRRRGRRHGDDPREHEDGDPGQGPVRGPGPGDPGRRSTRRSTRGGALLRIDRIDDEARGQHHADGRVRRRHRVDRPTTCARRRLADLAAMRALVMGYDVSGRAGRGRCWPTTTRCATRLPIDDPELLARRAGRAGHLRRHVRAVPQPAGRRGGGRRRAGAQPARVLPRLPALAGPGAGGSAGGASAAGWPAALAHYGVTDLEPSPELEEAVYRVFLAQERAGRPDPDHHRPAGAVAQRACRASPRTCGRRPARSSSGWWWPPGCATRWSVTWPGASATRPSSGRSSRRPGPSVYDDVRGNSGLAGGEPGPDRSTRSGSTRWSPARSR